MWEPRSARLIRLCFCFLLLSFCLVSFFHCFYHLYFTGNLNWRDSTLIFIFHQLVFLCSTSTSGMCAHSPHFLRVTAHSIIQIYSKLLTSFYTVRLNTSIKNSTDNESSIPFSNLARYRCFICVQKRCLKCFRCCHVSLCHTVRHLIRCHNVNCILTLCSITSPYDTGDRCFIDNENMVVKKMSLFATTFTRSGEFRTTASGARQDT